MDSNATLPTPVIEWLTTPQGVLLLDGPPRMGMRQWEARPGLVGLGVEVLDPVTGMCYNIWLPEEEALNVRNTILGWWPLDRFPLP